MRGESTVSPLRTRIYIDGYNLYYGCLKGTPHKWLDICALFERHIIPSVLVKKDDTDTVATVELLPLAIKFFTAEILEKAAKAEDSISSQRRYHTALRKARGSRIELICGYYSLVESKAKIVDADDPTKWPRSCQDVLVWKLEEKQSDVNLALQLYHDAVSGAVDHQIVVTNDTDIAPALKLIRDHTPVIVGLVVPTRDHQRHPNADLKKYSHWVRTHITDRELAASQFPRVIQAKSPVIKPFSWYAHPELIEEILSLVTPIAGDRNKAFKWMGSKNPELENQIPFDLAETKEGAAVVIASLNNYLAAKLAP
ncbi:DUF2384 domain-containing protein [Oxalobacteraceae bacterium CAVE-383]|nr:DUF2384 domain-containing protein [Oxalobacteraceae bacterium CAVE-383]